MKGVCLGFALGDGGDRVRGGDAWNFRDVATGLEDDPQQKRS